MTVHGPRTAASAVVALLASAPLVAAAQSTGRSGAESQRSSPFRVNLAAGTYAGIALGQKAAAARRALPGSVQGSPSEHVTPLDAPSARSGVASVPGDARSIRSRGVSLIVERGRVRMMFITDPRAATLAGIGIGDGLRTARARLSGLVCRQANEDVPACGGRSGHYTALLVGDPIETITVSAIDTGWCFVRSDTCHAPTRTVQIDVR